MAPVPDTVNQPSARSGQSVCVLVNETNSAAKSYIKAGYRFREYYDTVFLTRCTNHNHSCSLTPPGHLMNTPRYFKPFLIAVVSRQCGAGVLSDAVDGRAADWRFVLLVASMATVASRLSIPIRT